VPIAYVRQIFFASFGGYNFPQSESQEIARISFLGISAATPHFLKGVGVTNGRVEVGLASAGAGACHQDGLPLWASERGQIALFIGGQIKVRQVEFV